MFILRDLLQPLQACFSDNKSGKERGIWFVYTLLCVTIHFTSERRVHSMHHGARSAPYDKPG